MASPCELYAYKPSFALALIAVVGFSALTAVQCFRMITTRTWNSISFVLGGLAELFGYIARLVSSDDVCNKASYGARSVFLLLGPSMLMISVNLIQTSYTRLLNADTFCWVPITWQQPLYLSFNLLLLLTQAIGGILIAASSSITTISSATKLIITIYVIQTLFWLYTLAKHLYTTIKLDHHPTEACKTRLPQWKRWKNLFSLAVSIIGMGRNIMRLTMAGQVQFLVMYEWPSYAFDGYQMLIVLGAWTIWYLPEKCVMDKHGGGYITLRHDRVVNDGPWPLFHGRHIGINIS